MSPGRPSIERRAAPAIVLVALALLAAAAAPAQGASTHPFKESWSTGASCGPRETATDAAGNVYVACEAQGPNHLVGSIRKFSPTGTPIPFSASVPYVSGNEINEDPVNNGEGFNGTHELGPDSTIDVDKSSARPGYIYVSANAAFSSSSAGVEVFAPSGEYVTSLKGGFFTGEAGGVGIDQDGYVYVVWTGCCGRAHMSKYDPTNFHEIRRMVPFRGPFGEEPFHGPCCVRIRPDNSGAIWVGWGSPLFDGSNSFGKWEADQFGTNLNAGEKEPNTVIASPSPFLREAFPEEDCPETQLLNGFSFVCSLTGQSFDVDLGNNDVYANQGNQVTPYSQGIAGDPVHQDGPSFGGANLDGTSQGVDIAESGDVYVTAEPNKVVRFSRGATLPTVNTIPAAIPDIGHTEATVRGTIEPQGGGPISGCRVQFGTTTAYGAAGSPVPCEQVMPLPDGATSQVSASLPGLSVGAVYHYRFEAENGAGANFGGDRLFEAKAVLDLETKPVSEIDRNGVTLNGQLDPDDPATEYFFEYGPSSAYGLNTLDDKGKGIAVTGTAGTVVPTPFALGHLQEGHTYHYRLVARNTLGTTRGQDLSFRTSSAPEISGTGAENITDTSADIYATINPVGFETEYHFEFGSSPSYDGDLPVPAGQLSGETSQKVSVHLEGLPVGATIHYRVVAKNKWGTSTSEDSTFDFRPPSCPNAHVRAQTGSSYLPDCRAYELVSPGYAGAVQLLPGEGFKTFQETFSASEFAQSPQNLGYASSPPRFVYWGALGSVNGIDTPNSLIDIYMATRTNRGWVTTMPGLKGNETGFSFGRACSESLDLCADHIGPLYVRNPETGENENIPKSESPFLYRADGTKLGRLPTNVGVIKDGTDFRGDQQFSGDFSHFIFSTQTGFTPDGVTSPPGSVYDNEISRAKVEVISKTKAGGDIQAEPAQAGDSHRVTGIVGVSKNGSHVLMAGTTNPYCNINEYPFRCNFELAHPARLYMRVGNMLTYEVSREKEVNFVGMTKDATKVFFTTTEQLLPGDEDSSRDLYMWEEEGDTLTLVSQQGALGNDDGCSATWVDKCGVQPLTPESADFSEIFELRARVQGPDDLLAAESGDVYFYSPEDLVPNEVGGDGERNLYLFRNGQLRLVTTFEPGTQVERSTISRDGSHAAFMTRSSLTAYASQLHREVYSYNADTATMRCASCNPAGTPPLNGDHVISVSEAGPFMADDGRTFFASQEALVPQDTDGIRDIYEYVNGRAQLISTGTAERESTGGLETVSAFFGNLQTGLESVSRDGSDVYFSTFESLVPEDQNGSFLKMYDARVNGGFDFNPDLGACAAADECHGAGTTPSPAVPIATGAGLGASGNLPPPGRQKQKAKHRKRHKKHKRHGGRDKRGERR